MLKYIPGIIGATAAMTAFRFLAMIDTLWVRFVIFMAVYVAVTILVDRTLANYGKNR